MYIVVFSCDVSTASESAFGPMTQRLVQSLIEVNAMTSPDLTMPDDEDTGKNLQNVYPSLSSTHHHPLLPAPQNPYNTFSSPVIVL